MPVVPSSARPSALAVLSCAKLSAGGPGASWRPRGNGSSSAAAKMPTITAIRTRFATVTWNIDQCSKVLGEFMLIAREGNGGRADPVIFHLSVRALFRRGLEQPNLQWVRASMQRDLPELRLTRGSQARQAR